ncbi:Rieske (2Fe-2S) protein [Yinghuangia sp. ASG 101]|uniref:Rieske (2Fe-2S) protein n=1 Tax=Yinghuangia sp. ASG 101 TaxID=2896848 RepID=UPI001E5AECF6|nr:Rieske (2Fe-2S) protein [Yinghuangia sp. ASG 101]UGQ10134.1 Rieske (2Fe-2S) protein [Yinghuangia sp. ASG 101]
MTPTTPNAPDRRTVLRGAAAVGAVGAVAVPLAACTTENSGAKAAGPRAGDAGPVTVGKVPDISVGAGKVFGESRVVVTRPEASVYKAFDARCPHQGCLVGEVEQGVVKCNCHGSQFDVNDGSVVRGPANSGLPELPLKVVDGDIVVG